MTQILPRAFKCISMRHQNRQGGIGEDMPRRSTEDHLTQTALCVRALDQQCWQPRRRKASTGFTLWWKFGWILRAHLDCPARHRTILERLHHRTCLALQLRSPFYVGSAGVGLMCASPDGPCDDVGGPDASLRKTNSDAPDFLN
jgi:hypothetical protein